ncbi:MAG: glycosyltransferase, partial [Verrucomicrobiota bacterium]
ACLYDENFRGSSIWRFFWRWKWSALYLHPIFQCDGEPMFRGWMSLSSLSSLALLDETRIEEFEALTGKVCVRMPDTAHRGSVKSVLSGRIEMLKGDRFAVVLNGFLHPQKGVVEFLDLVDRLDRSKYFFVLVGEIHLPDYDSVDQDRLLRFSQEVENGFAYFHRVIEEDVLNGVIESCDLVLAAYRDWKFSSNAVGKAATFRKPIIVTVGELMAHRVERFRLGVTVHQGDVDAMVTAIEQWRERSEEPVVSSHRDGYLREHSVAAFNESVAALLNTREDKNR